MQSIQIKSIKSKVFMVRFTGERVHLPHNIDQEVALYWQKLIKNKPQLRNGEVFTVINTHEVNDKVYVELAETNYAHYMYSSHFNGLGEYAVQITHSATLIITSDDKLIFGAMGTHTSRPGIIVCCGGGIDRNDITDEIVDMEHSALTELSEELGVDVQHDDQFTEFTPAYLVFGGPTGKMSVIYTLHTKQTSQEFLEAYNTFTEKLKTSDEDPEFGEIFFLDRNQETVDRFIAEHIDWLDEYMPILLRTTVK